MEQLALEDINLCIAHFCDESNIQDYPGISILEGLGLQFSDADPLTNITFD